MTGPLRNTTRRLGLACLVGLAATAKGQSPTPAKSATPAHIVPILTFRELDQERKERDIGGDFAPVDINSRIRIEIDRKELKARLGMTPNPAADDALKTATTLARVASKGKDSLAKLHDGLARWSNAGPQPDAQARADLQGALAPASTALLEMLQEAPPGSPLRSRLNTILEERMSVGDQYRKTFEAGAAEADRLTGLVRALPAQGDAYFQLGAWIQTASGLQPVHLPGFDTFREEPPTEFSRWNLALSDDQKAQLQGVSALAKDLNNKGAKALLDYKGTVGAALLKLLASRVDCVNDVIAKGQAVADMSSQAVATVKADLEGLLQDLRSYRDFLLSLRDKYTSPPPSTMSASDFLIGTNNDLVTLQTRTEAILTTLKALEALPAKIETTVESIVATVKAFTSSLSSCLDQVSKDKSPLQTVGSVISSLFTSRRIDTALLQFSDEVQKLDVENGPTETTLALTRAGPRLPGDSLAIRIAAAKKPANTVEDLETHEFKILQLLSHVNTAVLAILAHPTGSTSVRATFQAAPSYSVLYKPACRSAPCRELWDFGLGLNIAAVDFNKDDTPEMGVGATLSILRDYIQAGAGYNVFEGKFYWFFGLKLPVPTITLGGGAK